uniref:Uncharacterized protein n=1 Tax=Aegilops tauschii subsp. strangulata TaxID=200361 RepID=A0A453D6S5_AEGTS
ETISGQNSCTTMPKRTCLQQPAIGDRQGNELEFQEAITS